MAFTFSWVMGKDAQKAGIYNYIGLVVILIGLLLYRFGPDLQNKIKIYWQERQKVTKITVN